MKVDDAVETISRFFNDLIGSLVPGAVLAVGLAVMLSSLFPRGRVLFSVMAILVGMQRIVVSAHFPSDVFAGAAVGWLVAKVCVKAMNSRGDEFMTKRCM